MARTSWPPPGPISVQRRDAFPQQVASSLQSCSELGPGAVYRAIATAQRAPEGAVRFTALRIAEEAAQPGARHRADVARLRLSRHGTALSVLCPIFVGVVSASCDQNVGVDVHQRAYPP